MALFNSPLGVPGVEGKRKEMRLLLLLDGSLASFSSSSTALKTSRSSENSLLSELEALERADTGGVRRFSALVSLVARQAPTGVAIFFVTSLFEGISKPR